MLFETFYTPDDCIIIPTIQISAFKCDDCTKVHGWQIQLMAFWWGVSFLFGFDDPQEQEA